MNIDLFSTSSFFSLSNGSMIKEKKQFYFLVRQHSYPLI